jgi:hypothetical protein
MADVQGSAPFYERRWFKGAAAAVALAAAVLALVGAPKPWRVVADIFSGGSVALSNTEIVLDTSSAMAGEFESGETKFDAAVRAIGQSGERDDEGLALRRTSIGCEDEGELLVDFGTGHRDEVLSKAGEQHPDGESNIVSAVIEALGDFRTDQQLQEGPASTRRVLVFTTGRDECFSGNAARKIEAELEQAQISASFTLIALKASEAELEWLKALEDALESAHAYVETRTPSTRGQLEGVVEDVRQESRRAVKEGKEEQERQETTSG